jgi:hypothetical protein
MGNLPEWAEAKVTGHEYYHLTSLKDTWFTLAADEVRA